MEKTCPYCGTALPEHAVFCPYCARSINRRIRKKAPRHISFRFLRTILISFLVLAAITGIYLAAAPKTYDGMGELTYTDSDGTYQILTNVSSNPFYPMAEIPQDAGEREQYHFPLRLYINHKDSGTDASGIFLQKVEKAALQAVPPGDAKSQVQVSGPISQKNSFPGTALISYVNFNKECASPTQLIWTLTMENGDTLRLRTNLVITPIHTHHYNSKNADLSDSAALQALIDRLAKESDSKDAINITLPAVTYTEPVVLWGRSFHLIGSEENGKQTTFTAGVQLRPAVPYQGWISQFTGIHFAGDGTGVGLSAANRVWIQNCRFSNWNTAVLNDGDAWVNAFDCIFEGNETGLYINSTSSNSSDTRFTGNTFHHNQTAVVLESIPTRAEMNFDDCVFEDNGIDIDNRCQQAPGISHAVFQ